MKIVLRIMAIFLALIGLVALICGLAGQQISLGIVGGVAIIMAICIFIFAGKQKKAKIAERQYIYMTDEQLASIEADHLPEIQVPNIMRKAGEIAHYYTAGGLNITKRQAVGRTGTGGSISFRIAKGIYLHSGKSGSQTIYSDVTNMYSGLVVITNQRFIFLQAQHGFEVPISRLTAVSPSSGGLILQANSKVYDMSFPYAEYPYTVICKIYELNSVK